MRLRAPYIRGVKHAYGCQGDTTSGTGVVYEDDTHRYVQFRIEQTAPVTDARWIETPFVWGLSRQSSGACSLFTSVGAPTPAEIPELVMGNCKIVHNSNDGSNCLLKTFYYKYYEKEGGQWVRKGWIPSHPDFVHSMYYFIANTLDGQASTCTAVPVTSNQDSIPYICPEGDADAMALALHLVDAEGLPLAGIPATDMRITVTSTGTTVPRFVCPSDTDTPQTWRPELFEVTDSSGDIVIELPPLAAGCQGAVWSVQVSGITLTSSPSHGFRSPDFNADGQVNTVDFGLFANAYGSHDWKADLNGDGSWTPVDVQWFTSHFGDKCAGAGRGSGLLTRDAGDARWHLSPPVPNPTSDGASLMLTIMSRELPVRADVYDLRGRLVRNVCGQVLQPGVHELRWDGRNADGTSVASGVYFLSVHVGTEADQRKLLIVR